MSHELEILDGRALVLGRENMWHQLGQVTGTNFGEERIMEYAPEILSPVELVPTYVIKNGTEWGAEYVQTPTKGAIMRECDQKVVGEGLGLDTYGVVQSRDAFEWGQTISEFGDLPLVSAGLLREGRQFFFTYQMGAENPAGIDYNPYLTVCSSHDGSLSLQAMTSTIITVCANTLQMNLSSGKNVLTLKHTSNVEQRMSMALAALQATAENVEATNKQIETLVRLEVRNFSLLLDGLLPTVDTQEGQSTRGSTVRETARDAVRSLLRSQVIEDEHRNTGWAWVQAVNTYEQWTKPIRGGDQNRAVRQFDNATKGIQPLTQAAVKQVLALV